MTNYKMLLAYDGTRYSGWQVQGNTDNTIQGKIEKLLSDYTGEAVEIAGSGRTDAGVHAKGQVANFRLNSYKVPAEIMDYLNEKLPRDIAVKSIEEADARFHARLSAKSKTYVYRIHTSKASNVFEHRFVYEYREPLKVDKMKEAANYLLGSHDFKSFCGNSHMKKSTVRTITNIQISESPTEITISYTGDGFLQNMVRILTGTLIEVGAGKRFPDSMPSLLESKNRANAGFMAPAQGLCLEYVEY